MQNLTNNGFLANENDELRRRAQSTSSASFGWGKIQNFESSITSNNQSDVDIAISPLNLNTPVDLQMLERTENSAFIATGALSSTSGMSSLIGERDISSSHGVNNYFTPDQDLGPLFNAVADSLF